MQWPRLYLDTGVLLDIADSRIESRLLSRLLAAIAQTGTVLIVSKDHMQDVVPRSDDATTRRFCAAVERFPFRAVVDREPYQIEPWTDGPKDVGLRPIDDLFELLTEPEARPHLAELSAAQARLHTATTAAQTVSRTAVQPLSRQGHELALQCLVTLASGWKGTDVPEILDMWEAEHGRLPDDAERDLVVQTLAPWAVLLREHERQYALTDEDRGKMLRALRDSADDTSHVHSPGLFLARRLTRCQHRNRVRRPLLSDSVDRMHASYFPYVDVATCDAGAFACLSPHLDVVRGPRTPQLFKNGDLESVAGAILSYRPIGGVDDAAQPAIAADEHLGRFASSAVRR